MEKELQWPAREDARWSMGVLLAAERCGVPVEELFGTPEDTRRALPGGFLRGFTLRGTRSPGPTCSPDP